MIPSAPDGLSAGDLKGVQGFGGPSRPTRGQVRSAASRRGMRKWPRPRSGSAGRGGAARAIRLGQGTQLVIFDRDNERRMTKKNGCAWWPR